MKKTIGWIILALLVLCLTAASAADTTGNAAADAGDPFKLVIENHVVVDYTGDPREAPATLVIPDGVTKIGGYAFRAHLVLEEVAGDKISNPYSPVFTAVKFPSSLTEIDNYAFRDYPNLVSITFPASLERIGNSAFKNCAKLATVVFSGGKKLTCAESAFEGCPALATVQFSGALKELEAPGMFRECTGLKTIAFPNSLTEMKAAGMFEGCSSLTSVTFPKGLEKITWTEMFAECSALTECPVPPGVTAIANGAYEDCTGLTAFSNAAVTSVGSSAFSGCTKLATVTLPNAGIIGKEAFSGCTALNKVTLTEEKGIDVGEGAFEDCKALNALGTPLSNVGKEAFESSGIQTVTILPKASIGENAFRQTNVKISGYKNSPAEAYAKANGHPFNPLTVSFEVTTISNASKYQVKFRYTEKEKSFIDSYNIEIAYKDKTEKYTYYPKNDPFAFQFHMDTAMKLKQSYSFDIKVVYKLSGGAEVPLGKTTVKYKYTGETELPSTYSDSTGKYSIDKMKATFTKPANPNAASLSIPNSIKVDGETVPVTAVANNACKGMPNLSTVSIGSKITKIGKNAFQNCAKLKKIKGGAGLVTIGDGAFKGCKALTAVTLNSKVTTIGKEAFSGCKKLKTITIKTALLTSKTVGKNAFKGIDAKPTVKCPKEKLTEYKKMLVKKGIPKKAKFK